MLRLEKIREVVARQTAPFGGCYLGKCPKFPFGKMHLDNFISYFDNICSVKPLVTSFLIIGIVNFSSVFTNILVECQRVQTMTS